MKIKNKALNEKVFLQACATEGLPQPKTEFRFAKDAGRLWRADYFFADGGRKVALEVEGGIWKYGRHNQASGFTKDMEKYNAMAVRGILLLRVTPAELNKLSTITMIKNALYGTAN